MRYYVITAIIALAAAKAKADSGNSINIGSSNKKEVETKRKGKREQTPLASSRGRYTAASTAKTIRRIGPVAESRFEAHNR